MLRPVDVDTARALLEGTTPRGMVAAADYPSEFSLEVMDLLAGPRAVDAPAQFGPFFVVLEGDGVTIGEIGAFLDPDAGTAQVGYSIVRSCWGRGYATEALRALIAELLRRDDVRRVIAETMVDHVASRRVMEKAGMRLCGQRSGVEAGEPVELVTYEIVP